MKLIKWISLTLLGAVMGCAVDGSENGISEAQDGESASNASVAQPLTAGEGADAVVTDGPPPVIDSGEPIGDDFAWENLWLNSGASSSVTAQSCATASTLRPGTSSTLGTETSASACCVPTSWSRTGRTAVTDKVSGIYWNSRDTLGAGQQIRFKAQTGIQYSRLTRSCKLEYAWVYHSSQYQLRNCSSEDSGWTTCTGWTGFKYYSQRQLQLCGGHASPPAGSSYWGCAFGSKHWVRWL